MAETKIPSIYRIPSKVDPELKRYLESVQEAVEVRLGLRGDALDQAVTHRDLVDSGIAIGSLRVGQTSTSVTPSPTPTNSQPPTGLVASCAFTKIMLTWDDHGLGTTFAYAEIFRSDGNILDNAIPLATTTAAVYTDAVDYNQTWYYWVRFVSNSNPPITGKWTGPASCTTAENIEEVMGTLSETLADLPGYSTLTTAIDVDITAARLAAIAGAAFIIRATSAPSVRDTSPTTPLQAYDVWIDTDDNNQMYVRNTANNGWEEARDGTLVTLVNAHATTISGHTSSIASAVSDIATVTTAQTATAAAVTALTATVDTKAQTFAQDGEPADNTANALLSGDLWIDTNDSNKLYRWDGDSWEEMIDPSSSGITVYAQDAEPSGGAYIAGDLWFDTNDGNKQYRYSGSAWVAIDDARISTTAGALTTLTNTVTGTGGHASQLTALNAGILLKTQTFAQNSIPTSVAIGDLWIDTDSVPVNKMYRANAIGVSAIVTSGNGWYALPPTTTKTFAQDGVPTSVTIGDLWIDTDAGNKMYRANAVGVSAIVTSGNGWYLLEDARIALNATAVSNLSTAVGLDGTSSTKITALEATVDDETTGVDANAGAISTLNATVNVKTRTFADNTEPANPYTTGGENYTLRAGDLWIDTNDENKMYRWTGSAWFGLPPSKVKTFVDAPTPAAENVGDLWFDNTNDFFLKRATATGTGSWVAVADARIASTAESVEALEASVGKVYGARIITANTDNTVTVETMVNADNETTTAVHGITSGQVNAGVFLTLQGFGNYNGVEAAQLNKTFKVATWVSTTRLTVEIVGDPATGSGTGSTLADGVTIGTSAGFTQLATVTADMQGNAQAAYVLQVNANGTVGGMVIEANSSASGDDSGVAIQFTADKFAIWNGSSAVAPFIVSGGTVYILDAAIQDGAIDNAKIANATIESAKIVELNADKIRTGTLNASAVIKVGNSGNGATDQRVQIDTAGPSSTARIIVVDTSS